MKSNDIGNPIFTQLQLETERCIIRPYKEEDLYELFQVVSDANFYDYIPEVAPSLQEVEGIIKWSIQCNQKNRLDKIYKLNLAIVHKELGKVIGFCGLGPYDIDASKVEVYYGVGKEFRGRGIATEATRAVLQYGFKTLKLDEIVTTVFPENRSSVAILHKLGMKYQYTLQNLSDEYKEFEGYDYYTLTGKEYK
ncbi:GNAT family N-acetyltransferase [Bacillus manliponensis]|uniref:GNAT family N-acetyltransferase n=1 Tax=Bacillus manliponensis TaxID=574376 RepID=UPI00069045C9|nr:GNAT family N-acetyltransferase [Bacillus manliponensis]